MLYTCTLLTDSNTTENIKIHTHFQSFWRRNIINVFMSLPLTAVKIFAWKYLKYEQIDSYKNNVERTETAYLYQLCSFRNVPTLTQIDLYTFQYV